MAQAMRNPFTPTFGGPPGRFFGRTDVIERVTRALAHPESPDAALFITGTRGCGKTALLERLSQKAREQRWQVIDVHSLNAVDAIMRRLLGERPRLDAKAKPQVSLPGGVSISIGADSAVGDLSNLDLSGLLVQRASSLVTHEGILISIDEIQKISEPDLEQICAAVQMTRRKGLPVALMLAGLPGSKELVASYRGCTFMQRVDDVHLGGLLIDETVEAFGELLSLVPEAKVDEDAVWALASMSQGYPYLIQLVGYCFVEHLFAAYPIGVKGATEQDIAAIEEEVYQTYRENVLVPSLKGLGNEGRTYLRAMGSVLNEEGFARTADVANSLGKSQKQLSSCRQNLIERRLILPTGRGTICYGLPYLRRFSTEGRHEPADDLRGRFIPQ